MDLTGGQNVPLVSMALTVRLQQSGAATVDLVALLVNDRGLVSADADFVFYNAPRHPSGGVTLSGQMLSLDLHLLPAAVERVVVAVNSNGEGQLDDLTVLLEGNEHLTFAPSSLAGLPTAVLAEVYRRGGAWRVRAVGQGWAAGLAGLAREYGVNVEGESDQPETGPDPDLAPVRLELERLTELNDARAAWSAATRARPRQIGQHEQPGAAVVGVGLKAHVAALHEVLDQLGCRLLGHPEVSGEVGGGRRGAARVDAGPDGASAWVATAPGLKAVTADGTRIIPPWARGSGSARPLSYLRRETTPLPKRQRRPSGRGRSGVCLLPSRPRLGPACPLSVFPSTISGPRICATSMTSWSTPQCACFRDEPHEHRDRRRRHG